MFNFGPSWFKTSWSRLLQNELLCSMPLFPVNVRSEEDETEQICQLEGGRHADATSALIYRWVSLFQLESSLPFYPVSQHGGITRPKPGTGYVSNWFDLWVVTFSLGILPTVLFPLRFGREIFAQNAIGQWKWRGANFDAGYVCEWTILSSLKVHFKDANGNLLKTVEANEGDDILSIAHEYDIDLEGGS